MARILRFDLGDMDASIAEQVRDTGGMSKPARDSAWWDARYASRPSLWGAGPNRFVAEAFQGVPPRGRALDLACGEGRNAVWLAEQGYDPAFGARPLRRTLQKQVESPLSVKLLRGEFKSGDTVIVDYNEDEGLAFIKKDELMVEVPATEEVNSE